MDQYLDMRFKELSSPHSWMSTARSLLVSAEILYEQYLESICWLKKHSLSHQENKVWEFTTDFAGRYTEEIYQHVKKLNLQGYFLLQGCALENAVKAILIKIVPEFTPNKNNRKTIAHHNLKVLFEKINVSLDESLSNLLERLTDCIYWAGRYPHPLEREHFQYKPLPDGSVLLAGHYKDGDHNLIENLWKILINKWKQLIEKER